MQRNWHSVRGHVDINIPSLSSTKIWWASKELQFQSVFRGNRISPKLFRPIEGKPCPVKIEPYRPAHKGGTICATVTINLRIHVQCC